MAEIIPDTELQFFRNIHIDPDHENTIYFPSESAKDAYFDNIPHATARKCYYQREHRGYCRVEIPLSQLLNRQYMRFKNSQFEDKWFYAFVNNVEYINNQTTEVHYTFDPVMTWMGQFDLDECFIERQHTETDNIGDNVVPEQIVINRYVNNALCDSSHISPMRTNITSEAETQDPNDSDWEYLIVMNPNQTQLPAGNIYGLFSGLHYEWRTSANDVILFLQTIPDAQQERVLGIFYVPKFFKPTSSNPAPSYMTFQIGRPVAGSTDIGGYNQVKNNKLYTYPFNFLRVLNTEGDEVDLPFENFMNSGSVVEFRIEGIVGEQTQITCTPKAYLSNNVQGLGIRVDPRYQLSMKEFPMCAWVSDTYRAYLAQQCVSIPTALTGAMVSSVLTGSPLTGVASMAGTLLSTVTDLYQHSNNPTEKRGENLPLLSCVGTAPYKDFLFYRISVIGEEAERIDSYFTMFGYAINDKGVPNMCARPYYTYVKTIGCHVNSVFMPADDVRFVEDCFNKGLRLWNGAELASDPANIYIGNYSLNNAPVPPSP